MTKFTYIANIRLPTEKAHGIQIMEMCKAFAALGNEVTLVVPNRATAIKDDPFVYYDIEPSFAIKRLWCIDTAAKGRAGFWLESVSFAASLKLYALFQHGLFYTRDELLALVLKCLGKRVAWEAHMGQKNFLVKLLIKLGVPFVVITDALKQLYILLGAHAEKILVASDGADIDRFDLNLTQAKAREMMSLPIDKKIILYKGSLIPWKGAGTLAEAARFAKTRNLEFVFIGGSPEDVANLKKEFTDIPNLSIRGNRPRKETPIYQKGADLLVIPNSAKEDISKLYTSPMKLFGYMAGGVPIVASDLPSIREVLDDSLGYFAEPDDAESLAQAIDRVFAEYDTAKTKAAKALEEVRKYSWKERAKKILLFMAPTWTSG